MSSLSARGTPKKFCHSRWRLKIRLQYNQVHRESDTGRASFYCTTVCLISSESVELQVWVVAGLINHQSWPSLAQLRVKLGIYPPLWVWGMGGKEVYQGSRERRRHTIRFLVPPWTWWFIRPQLLQPMCAEHADRLPKAKNHCYSLRYTKLRHNFLWPQVYFLDERTDYPSRLLIYKVSWSKVVGKPALQLPFNIPEI